MSLEEIQRKRSGERIGWGTGQTRIKDGNVRLGENYSKKVDKNMVRMTTKKVRNI